MGLLAEYCDDIELIKIASNPRARVSRDDHFGDNHAAAHNSHVATTLRPFMPPHPHVIKLFSIINIIFYY